MEESIEALSSPSIDPLVIHQQTGVYLHYLPGHEEDQVLLEGKLDILENNSHLSINWKINEESHKNRSRHESQNQGWTMTS